MKPGIEKEDFLRVLTEMAHSLEEAETILQWSSMEIRETMYMNHSLHLEETSILLNSLERKLPNPTTVPYKESVSQPLLSLN